MGRTHLLFRQWFGPHCTVFFVAEQPRDVCCGRRDQNPGKPNYSVLRTTPDEGDVMVARE